MKRPTKQLSNGMDKSICKWFAITSSLVFAVLAVLQLSGTFLAVPVYWLLVGFASGFLVVITRLTWLLTKAARHSNLLMLLAADRQVFDENQKLSQALLGVASRTDAEFRELAFEQLTRISSSVDELSRGIITYVDTETWRIAYDRLLRSTGLHNYRSVAWIKNAEYWRDPAGLHSMDTNFELVEQDRLNISRICILNDKLWASDSLPTEEVLNWVSDQHFRNIEISVVRESALAHEPELLADFGIYGYRAVGTQELGADGRTSRFQLSFDFADVERYEQLWTRLHVYSTNFAKLLDRTASC